MGVWWTLELIQGQFGFLAEFNPLLPTQSATLMAVPIGPWTLVITNHMFMVGLTAIFLGIGIPLALRPRRLAPAGWQNVIESICVYLREDVAKPVMHQHTDRYIGFIWTIFFFVLSLNLLGMIPSERVVTLVTGQENHWGGPATANIFVTGALAVVTFVMTHATGIRQQGLGHYIAHFAPPGPWWIRPLLFLIEIIGAFIRPLTLAIRLFANIVAGHIVLATFFGLILIFKSYAVAAASVSGAVALSLLELLVAFIQAFIFAFLSALYIGFAVSPEH
jgi:F-type H+-transporting ATPase subunit a